MSEVLLTDGQVALVDERDLTKVASYRWYPHTDGYAIAGTTAGERVIYMHRLVLDAPAGLEVDHRNNDKLDNRRANLRLATRADQVHNTGPRSDSRSGFKGVTRQRNGRWHAYIGGRGDRRHLGSYATAEEAARVYDAAASLAYGEFAYLNFPELETSPA